MIPWHLECQKKLLNACRPLRGLECSLVLVFCLETSPKLFAPSKVGLESSRNDGAMVESLALWMEKDCRHETSKECSSIVARYNSWEVGTLKYRSGSRAFSVILVSPTGFEPVLLP